MDRLVCRMGVGLLQIEIRRHSRRRGRYFVKFESLQLTMTTARLLKRHRHLHCVHGRCSSDLSHKRRMETGAD